MLVTRHNSDRESRDGSGGNNARSAFTFVEILMALAIFALSLGMALSVLGAARDRTLRAERRWARQHNLNEVTEFFLLAGSGASVPAWLLAEGYSATCRLEPVVDVPDFAVEAVDGWVLVRWHVSLLWRDGSVVAEHSVEKLTPSDEVLW